ncbi:MAG: type II secretion system F family protein [Gordonia sp. (in: high G+C Gram-positive bacteria)]
MTGLAVSGALAAAMLAVACWIWPPPEWALYRLTGMPVRNREPRWLGKQASRVDEFDVAAGYDLLAVCLRTGLPVATAAREAARACPPSLAEPLLRVAELLTLGADPARAWSASDDAAQQVDGGFAELATLARRASRAGSSLADGVAELADAARARAANRALAEAERAGVKISGPLGLCFLPAFVCLGIAPVVIGLAGGLLGGL